MESVKRFRFKGADYVYAADFDRVTAEREALQQRLTMQDQRVDDLVTELKVTKQAINSLKGERDDQLTSLEQRRYAEQQAREAAERRVEYWKDEYSNSSDMRLEEVAELLRVQSELTKALELLREWLTSNFTGSCPERNDLRCRTDYALAIQSAPADKGQGEEIVFGCSRCGGTQEEWSAKCIHCHPAEQPGPVAVLPFKLISLPPSLTDHHAFDVLRNELEKVGVQVKEPKPKP